MNNRFVLAAFFSISAALASMSSLAAGDAAAGKTKAAACASCHGTALMGILPSTPALLGLPRDYLAAQLGAWQTGLRRAHAPDCMGRIAKALTPNFAEWEITLSGVGNRLEANATDMAGNVEKMAHVVMLP